MELRNRAFARVLSAGIVVGTVVAGPIVLAGSASADSIHGGSICGTVWHDDNEDGIRQANEPVMANHTIGVRNGTRYVNSGADGRYCLTGLPVGEYVLQSNDLSGWDKAWTVTGIGKDSKFTQTGLGFAVGDVNRGPIKITKSANGKYTKIDNYDSGFLDARVDVRTEYIMVDPSHGPRETYNVGEVIEIYASVANIGNAYEQLGATLTLPEGLTILNRAGGMPSYVHGQQVVGNFFERRFIGDLEWVGAVVRIDKPITAGEIKVETARGAFTDIDPGNNVKTRSITTVG